MYSNFKRTDDEGYLCEFEMVGRDEAIGRWLECDEAAMEDAERQITTLIKTWLLWLRCRDVEPPPCIRMDYLINRKANGRAGAVLHCRVCVM
eukprot:SAG22_NODE_260_length_13403_cov_57.915589_4_plen_92_part_00